MSCSAQSLVNPWQLQVSLSSMRWGHVQCVAADTAPSLDWWPNRQQCWAGAQGTAWLHDSASPAPETRHVRSKCGDGEAPNAGGPPGSSPGLPAPAARLGQPARPGMHVRTAALHKNLSSDLLKCCLHVYCCGTLAHCTAAAVHLVEQRVNGPTLTATRRPVDTSSSSVTLTSKGRSGAAEVTSYSSCFSWK